MCPFKEFLHFLNISLLSLYFSGVCSDVPSLIPDVGDSCPLFFLICLAVGFIDLEGPNVGFIDIVYFFLFCYTHRFLFFPFRFICPSFKMDTEIREETGDFFLVQAFSAGNFPSGVYTLAAFHEF